MNVNKLSIGFVLIFIGLMLSLAATSPINEITNQFILVSRRLEIYQRIVIAEIIAFVIFIVGLILIIKNK
ncbi:MAG: hypothetical protein ACP5GU_05385 [Thermoprotei archaeon]|jgi:uncharacterized membrane protein YidH (DUF202 family)